MKIILDDNLNIGIKDYLLSQSGINNVEILEKDFIIEIDIKFDNKTTPLIIMNYIELFQNNKYDTLLSFDKENNLKTKKLNYLIEDICCEHCYKSLIRKLYENELIKSVQSNFDFNKPAINISLLIEYNYNYNETELIKYIKENI